MRSNRNRHSARWLVAAALAAGAATALAANGFVVTPAQEKSIAPGMSTDQVMATLGRPAHVVRYRTEAGPTWTYNVVGALAVSGGEAKVFDVDFGADGRVATLEERTVEGSGGE
jgi:outer membrane protein assembly factor BamE (lipoprotein component of BamABCDE complex)